METEQSPPTPEEIRQYFATAMLPSVIRLDKGTTIKDVTKFIDTQLSILGSGVDSSINKSALDRLIPLYDLLYSMANNPGTEK
jgi:hypothetical protein